MKGIKEYSKLKENKIKTLDLYLGAILAKVDLESALFYIPFMGVLTNCTIRPLGLKVKQGGVREVKVRDASAIFTGIYSYTVIC